MEKKNTHLYLNEKHIKNIPSDLDSPNVLVLYLQNNSITKIDNLLDFGKLTHLYLQWNKIKRIENLQNLYNLKKLYLGNNNISVVEKLESLSNLRELYLEKQYLEYGDTICFEPKCLLALSTRLEVLNLSDNKLTNFDDISQLVRLSVLKLKNNGFANCENLISYLKKMHRLKTIDFRGNPISRIHHYKEKIIAACLNLDILDGELVSKYSRSFLKQLEDRQEKLRYKKTITTKGLHHFDNESNSKNSSPDDQLIPIDIQYAEAFKKKKKISNPSNWTIPKCFWRNKISDFQKKNATKPKVTFEDILEPGYKNEMESKTK